ncbi:MAG: hypothetical protein AAGC70_08155 [Pseudomonadota bacterium]
MSGRHRDNEGGSASSRKLDDVIDQFIDADQLRSRDAATPQQSEDEPWSASLDTGYESDAAVASNSDHSESHAPDSVVFGSGEPATDRQHGEHHLADDSQFGEYTDTSSDVATSPEVVDWDWSSDETAHLPIWDFEANPPHNLTRSDNAYPEQGLTDQDTHDAYFPSICSATDNLDALDALITSAQATEHDTGHNRVGHHEALPALRSDIAATDEAMADNASQTWPRQLLHDARDQSRSGLRRKTSNSVGSLSRAGSQMNWLVTGSAAAVAIAIGVSAAWLSSVTVADTSLPTALTTANASPQPHPEAVLKPASHAPSGPAARTLAETMIDTTTPAETRNPTQKPVAPARTDPDNQPAEVTIGFSTPAAGPTLKTVTVADTARSEAGKPPVNYLLQPADETGAAFPLRVQTRLPLTALSAILISDLPPETLFSAGTRVSPTSWGILPTQLSDLRIWLGSHDRNSLTFKIRVFRADGDLAGEQDVTVRSAKPVPPPMPDIVASTVSKRVVSDAGFDGADIAVPNLLLASPVPDTLSPVAPAPAADPVADKSEPPSGTAADDPADKPAPAAEKPVKATPAKRRTVSPKRRRIRRKSISKVARRAVRRPVAPKQTAVPKPPAVAKPVFSLGGQSTQNTEAPQNNENGSSFSLFNVEPGKPPGWARHVFEN